MQIAHQRFQPFFQHVRIDLRGRNIRVPEQGLHHPQIRAIVQKMAGEGVTQNVRAQAFRLECRRPGRAP